MTVQKTHFQGFLDTSFNNHINGSSAQIWSCVHIIGDDSNRRVIGPLFPSKILTSYSFLRELKQLPRALRGNKKAKAKSRRENQS